MASADLFCFSLFPCILLILSAGVGYGNGHQDCPHSFVCGHLGTFHYPFTKAEQPHCGLIPIHNCDNPFEKTIQLEQNGTHVELYGVVTQQNVITIFDEDFHKRLQENICGSLKNNYSLPSPSPLYSIYIKYNVTLFQCNRSLHINSGQRYFKQPCPDYDYDIYYDSLPSPDNEEEAHSHFSTCSVLQLPSKDKPDTSDILSFVSAEMFLQVVLSNDCDECYNHRGGQCRLHNNQMFFCDNYSLPSPSPLYRHDRGSKNKDKFFKLKLILGFVTGFGVLLSAILIIGCIVFRHKHTPSNPQCQSRVTHTDVIDPRSNPDPENGRVYFGIPLFSYNELKEATCNFHHSRQLGSGGFGTVYYGILRDGRGVAVKRLYEHNCRQVEQFMNEVHILTRLRHRNLVSLYGCTSSQSHELLLVYEHVPNGTVASHLHGELAKRGSLPWHLRMKIAVETASALAYLHASDTIHRDVKTTNILLNECFSVKVADFGLSRLFPNDVTHVSTAPLGTPGYVDPEYHQCYQLTNKSDVYSFGVVLIELISSMPAIDMNRHRGEINLSSLALKKIQQSAFSELVDPSLGFDSDSEVKTMMVSVAELAFQCLQRDRELRPSMDEVLKVLMKIQSGKDMAEHMDEEDLRPPSLPSPDWDENGFFKRHPSSMDMPQ
ncbi:hypothetical protein Fmac_023183 [Flemingia macrophylla]|uniref:Protein kinase domain-containing protein n=1 Tax=Flemingia macrophylla TaxID=520843 RepID=A0ABD1LMF3_9FABA